MERMNPAAPSPDPTPRDDALALWLCRDGPGCLVENLLPDGAVLGPYRVLGLLGRGGSAEVYRAVRADGGEVAALKVPRRRDDPAAAGRFRREARLLADHPHPALPRLVAAGETDGLPWLAMEELVPGDLPREPRDVERFLLALCRGIAHLHALGLVHRDIKPANILCRADGTPVLIDLGLVKESAAAQPFPVPDAPLSVVDGHAVGHGTPGWAAPEQFSGGDISPAADVYALGMLALDCFGGRAPRLWRPLLRRATSPLPAERPADAAAFARALRHRRRPLWGLAAALVVLAGVAAFAVKHAAAPRPSSASAARGTLEFVRGLLAAANPATPGGASSATVLAAAETAVPAIRAETDPTLRASLALETGALFESIGRLSEAADLYDLAVAAARQSGDAAALAKALHRRGTAARLAGRLEDADADLTEALTLRRNLAARDPAAEPDLAATVSSLGALRSFRVRPDEALALLREAVDIRRRLDAREPGPHRRLLARSLSNLGIELGDQERLDEAVAAHNEALTLFRARAAEHADGAVPNLARALASRADVLRKAGRLDDARADFDEALALLRPLANEEPGTYAPSLAHALTNRANLSHEVGDDQAALAQIDEALGILRELEAAEPGSRAKDIADLLHNRAIIAPTRPE